MRLTAAAIPGTRMASENRVLIMDNEGSIIVTVKLITKEKMKLHN